MSRPKPRKGHLVRNVLVTVIAVLFAAGVVVATPPIFFFNVTVSGTATAKASTAAGVTFVDENGVSYPAGLTGGQYSITLQNGHDYLVYVDYVTGGNCSAGDLNLNTLGWSQTMDASC